MVVNIHPHAKKRMLERGASEEEVIKTVESGENFFAKYERTGFRRNFSFQGRWRNKYYNTKQVEAYAIKEDSDWLVVSIITKYF